VDNIVSPLQFRSLLVRLDNVPMQIRDLQRLIDSVLLPDAAMRGDNIGVHVESTSGEVHSILVCLDVTDAVVADAVERRCDTILAFHPLIYTPLSRLQRSDRVGRVLCELIARNINLLCVHTAFDAYPQGTNYLLAKKLGLEPLRPLVPSEAGNGYGMGIVAGVEGGMAFSDLVERVRSVCGSPVRFLPSPSDTVRTVAIVGGSGESFTADALASGADVFVTADLKYHAFHAANGRIGLIDPGHYEMEQFVIDGIVDAVRPLIPADMSIQRSVVITNPVQYAPTTLASTSQS